MLSKKEQEVFERGHEVLAKAADEIKYLREDNAHLRTRLKMFDDVMLLINLRPPGDNGCMKYGNDILQQITELLKPV